ncbi:MAG: GNAT family N-acetyltransferase [Microthrixaceae bacterium]|nr:GNAT family N-acetyltransferase [Microthrixaceae bacterium]
MTLKTRDLTRADDPAVLALNNAEVPRVTALDEPALERYRGVLNDRLAIGPEGDPDGFCWTVGPNADYWSTNYAWVAERHDRFVYLDRVVVAPRARGRGVARALYDEVSARAVGVAEWFVLEVNTRPRNEESLAFHARLGFVEIGRAEPYEPDPETGAVPEVAYLARPVPPS